MLAIDGSRGPRLPGAKSHGARERMVMHNAGPSSTTDRISAARARVLPVSECGPRGYLAIAGTAGHHERQQRTRKRRFAWALESVVDALDQVPVLGHYPYRRWDLPNWALTRHIVKRHR